MQPLSPPTADVLDRLDRFLGPALLAIPPGRERRLAATYVRGLLGPSERKNAERIARQARGAERAPAFERDLTEMLASDLWRHEAVMGEAAARLLATTSGWQAYTLDDRALLKQGDQSVGVSNQYAGCVGGLANCQSLVTLGVAQEHASAPLAMSLYLPQRWDEDAERRARCHVPEEVRSQPKWQIGRELLEATEVEGLPPLPVLADSAYGDVTEFRRWLQERGRPYVVAASMTLTVWPEGTTFGPRPSPRGAGRPATRLQPTTPTKPCRLDASAATLSEERWTQVEWRHGSRGVQRARFAAVRVRPALGVERERRASRGPLCRGVAPSPLARRGAEADQGVAVQPPRRDAAGRARGPGAPALVDRARLPRGEGPGGVGPLRGLRFPRFGGSPALCVKPWWGRRERNGERPRLS